LTKFVTLLDLFRGLTDTDLNVGLEHLNVLTAHFNVVQRRLKQQQHTIISYG